MSFLADSFIAILSIYLAFTNALADRLITLLDLEVTSTETAVVESKDNENIATVPTKYERGGMIPDILLRSAQYQEAAALGALSENGTSSPVIDPKTALVNIFCEYVIDNTRYTRTGTGFFIDTDGVILTNAHVAQFLLLTSLPGGGESECVARAGDPAVPTYIVELLYISPAWILEHADLIDDTNPSGTGERDYALLYVSEGVDNPILPGSFPALPLHTDALRRSDEGSSVTVAGYPAEALLREDANADLIPRTASTTINELFTFSSNLADIFSLRGSSIGERGTSGGPVLNADGEVIGMVSTRGDDATDGEGSLRAITISHIDRTITEETSFDLEANLNGDLPFRGRIFNQTLGTFLSGVLGGELE